MTAAAAPSAAPSPISRNWRLVAFLVIAFGPFLPSLIAMRDFLLSDNAVGFTPFALVAALYLLWVRGHGETVAQERDLFTDLFLLVPLMVIAFFILYVTPSSLSWYFWLNRIDLAALAPWAVAVALAFFGYQQVIRTWPAWVMLVLAWPYVALRVQSLLPPLFVDATSWVAQRAIDFLRLPYEADPDALDTFTTTHLPEEENFTLIIGQLCSGTAATIGFFIVGITLAMLSDGRPMAKAKWLAAGLLLAFLSNLVRVVVLFAIATSVSREFAVDTLHPILGLALFAIVVLAMLLLLRPFGLRFRPLPRGSRVAWEPIAGGRKGLVAVWTGVVVAAFGIGGGVAQAQDLDFIGAGDGAPEIAVDSFRTILPMLDGWDLRHETEISWTDLFGRSSRGDVFSYLQDDFQEGDAFVAVQTVVTASKSTLERYTLEQCIDFHGRDLEARQAVDLGHGMTGYILHHENEGLPSSMLYWLFPVNVDGEISHARIALFGDTEFPTLLPEARDPGADSSGVTQLGQRIENAMDGLPDAAADDVRAELDRGLLILAREIVATMVATGGPAAQDGADILESTATPES